MDKKDLEFAQEVSEKGYKIYENLRAQYKEDTDEDFGKIHNCIESALVYFIINEIPEECYESYCNSFFEHLKKQLEEYKEHKKEQENKTEKNDDDYIFSKSLRDAMSKFNDVPAREAITMPSFYDALLDHAGLSKEEKKNIWTAVGRKDIADRV